MEQIINSLLETDLYKFSMGQAIYHQFPDYRTTWSFKCRNTDVHFTEEMVEEIRNQIKAYCNVKFTEEELEYLSRITWFKTSYIDFLRLWHPRYEELAGLQTEHMNCRLLVSLDLEEDCLQKRRKWQLKS